MDVSQPYPYRKCIASFPQLTREGKMQIYNLFGHLNEYLQKSRRDKSPWLVFSVVDCIRVLGYFVSFFFVCFFYSNVLK